MRFRVLSHAGLAVETAGVQLVCDPWLVGSTYWRSWWNYPPPRPEDIAALRPSFIYLTHIHWDHFQAVSMRRFDPATPVLIPKAPGRRLCSDLRAIGFGDVRELDHGRSIDLAPGFRLTSYHFSPFLDSAVVVEADGVCILNANDAKLMGPPLRQVLRRHPRIDFVLRSHSSANSRMCFTILDDPGAEPDDLGRYVREFAAFAIASRARYAVPFASNHCYLHPDVWRFNRTVTTPQMVKEHFRAAGIGTPEVVVMVAGDAWSSEAGFDVRPNDYFSRRARHLEAYRRRQAEALSRQDELERRAVLDWPSVQRYFDRLRRSTPWPLRRLFRGSPITYVLTAGNRVEALRVDLYRGRLERLRSWSETRNPSQVHAPMYVFMQCVTRGIFSHLPISKRVQYRVTSARRRRLELWNFLFNLYEYEILPVRSMLAPRFAVCWLRRWRECLLYGRIAFDRLRGVRFDPTAYLPLTPDERARAGFGGDTAATPDARRSPRRRGAALLRTGALGVGATAVTLLVLELVVRRLDSAPQIGPVFTTHTQELGLWNKSNLDCMRIAPEYRTRVTTNRHGMRGPEVALEKPAGTRRILCIGDSFTFGKGVEDSATYAARMAEVLAETATAGRYEVLHAGAVGFGTANEHLYLT